MTITHHQRIEVAMKYVEELYLWAEQNGDKVQRVSGYRGLELCLENHRGNHTDGNRLSALDFMPPGKSVKPPYFNIFSHQPKLLPELETQAKHLIHFLETGEVILFKGE